MIIPARCRTCKLLEFDKVGQPACGFEEFDPETGKGYRPHGLIPDGESCFAHQYVSPLKRGEPPLSEIRKKKEIGDKLTVHEHFRLLSSEIMRRYVDRGKWTEECLILKDILEELGLILGEDFYHNFRIHNEDQSGYFSLDIYLPDYSLCIEGDSLLWHGDIGDARKKDERRDAWLLRNGIFTLRLRNEDIRKHRGKVKDLILKFLVWKGGR